MPAKGQINPAIRDESGNIIPWKKRNRIAANASTRARQANRPAETKRSERYRWLLKHKYGLSPELKQALIQAQGGICLICHVLISIDCATDHDHEKGFVRGMLCKPCNSALGLFKEDPEILRNAANYLESCKSLEQEPTTEDFIEANKILKEVLCQQKIRPYTEP